MRTATTAIISPSPSVAEFDDAVEAMLVGDEMTDHEGPRARPRGVAGPGPEPQVGVPVEPAYGSSTSSTRVGRQREGEIQLDEAPAGEPIGANGLVPFEVEVLIPPLLVEAFFSRQP